MTPSPALAERIRRSADPVRASAWLERLARTAPEAMGRVETDGDLAEAAVSVAAASGWLGRLLIEDPDALTVLADLDRRVPDDIDSPTELPRWRHLEHLRLAARDLTGRDPLETTMAGITSMAVSVLDHALRLAGAEGLAVIGMGKAGGNELNYGSDVDVLLVAGGTRPDQGAARRFLNLARTALRVDVNLRPEGRDGALVRSVDSYRSYWERWARPWERQALLKARPLAGDAGVAGDFALAAATDLWERPFDAQAIHQVRTMKARTERHAVARADGDGEIKRSPGGLRDIEFSVQLLQIVHGPLDEALRVRGTLPALTALADGGYVDPADAGWLRASYRFLRRIEHAVQLDEDRQTHTVPSNHRARTRLARVLGYTDRPSRSALDEFDRELSACRATVRATHERIYFRPLLDAFTDVDAPLTLDAAAARLSAFGFADAERTRQAVTELTRGLTRSSRLMARLLPLLLDWLSSSPDPDAGLLNLRTVVSRDPRAVAATFRDSPEAARRLCLLAGTSSRLVRELMRAPELLDQLVEPLAPEDEVSEVVRRAVVARRGDEDRRAGLRRAVRREQLRVGLADILDDLPLAEVGAELAGVARAAVESALAMVEPRTPVAVLALGRLAGGELGYASDLDLVFVHDADSDEERAEAERVVDGVRRVLQGSGPAERIFDVDLDLRPGGRASPLVRSRAGFAAHLERWAEPWELLALARIRPLAGDAALAESVTDLVAAAASRSVAEADLRAIRRIKARMETERIPAGEDPVFHLKLGPGALADIELTVDLMLLLHGLPEAGTVAGIEALRAGGHLSPEEAVDLVTAHQFCERARNRWSLVAEHARDSLPSGDDLTVLARSLGTTAPELRNDYRRATRRARRVVERHFYGNDPTR